MSSSTREVHSCLCEAISNRSCSKCPCVHSLCTVCAPQRIQHAARCDLGQVPANQLISVMLLVEDQIRPNLDPCRPAIIV
jgi:hypothetical protein